MGNWSQDASQLPEDEDCSGYYRGRIACLSACATACRTGKEAELGRIGSVHDTSTGLSCYVSDSRVAVRFLSYDAHLCRESWNRRLPWPEKLE